MQRIVWRKPFINVRRLEVKPAFLIRIPRYAKHLHLADFIFFGVSWTVKLDHVLLQRSYTKNVFDFKVRDLTIGTFSVNHESFAVTKHF